MKFVIQRVTKGKVSVDDQVIGKINQGYVVLIGVSDEDSRQTADKMLKKMLGLRIFADENGKTNLALKDINGELLMISQFTLYADCKKGNRPSFIKAGKPDHANALYEYLIDQAKKEIPVVETGSFGADMQIELINDGPFTVILDSDELFGQK
ncbi:MAG TPA: D-tyrosyl-tRNA(Tyr) deacylase [Candidatus Eubacterium avistercoris]|uniref:D-aminoacyl-tRNA deacylase n=1 Tax=Candidatus Eubacterium avistercoris TaxID=2838567 RepID=A0A9D2IFU9_9FIRM|nr:D-tyrosyl-tRNA(Tyr) deacylase [Candidatus Eubacterium avistercoris]